MNHLNGVEVKKSSCHGFRVQKVSIKSKEAAKELDREIGDYITVSTGNLLDVSLGLELGNCLAEILEPLLAPYFGKRLLICGLGNPNTVSDSLGPATVDKLPAFFLEGMEKTGPGRFEKLVTVKPGVPGDTNLETETLLSGIAAAARADCLILIDSIGTTDGSRLCNNVQISTAGGMTHCMTGGKTDLSALGLPVLSIGVPTVVSAAALRIKASPHRRENWLAPSCVQDVVEAAAALLVYALVKVSYPSYEEKEYIEFTTLNQGPPVGW